MIGTEAAFQNIELEQFNKKIPDLIYQGKTLYSLMKDRFPKVPQSNITEGGSTQRASMRVPFRVQGGPAISQGTGNGDSMGSGNASVYQSFVGSPVYNYAVQQLTELSELATKGKDRSTIGSLKAKELKNSLDSALNGFEALLYGDGSGALFQIPSTATISSGSGTGNETSFITGVLATITTDNAILQFFPAEGGSSRGSATVSVNDPVTGTIWFSTDLPSGTAVGDYIVVNGSSGAVGSGILGTTSWINSSTSGTQAGYNRALYPSRTSSPSINLNGGAVTASLSARIERLLGQAMGGENKTKDSGIYLFGDDQAEAVATTTYYQQRITQQSDRDGNKVPDTSRKYFSGTFGQREVNISYNQPRGRIDMLLTDDWLLGVLVDWSLYDYTGEGNYAMPVPDGSGNWTTARQSCYRSALQVFCSAPRHQLFVENAAQP